MTSWSGGKKKKGKLKGNIQKLETAPMFFNRYTGKQIVIHQYNEIILSSEKEQTIHSHNLDESQMYIA